MTTTTAKVLLLTNSEYGQANVFLALAHEFSLRNVDLDLASFPPLLKRLTRQRLTEKLTFHTIFGLSYEEALTRTADTNDLSHPPGVSGAIQSYRYVVDGLFPWTAEEYHQQLLSIQSILEEVRPTITVVDSLLNGALDVCKKMNWKCVVLSPNSPKDYIGMSQPALRGFWKYPALSSGFPYPVPLTLIPANIYLNIRMIIKVVTSPIAKSYDKIRKDSHGLAKTVIDQFAPDIPYIFPALPQTEFPGFHFPTNINLCGPILLPSTPLESFDSDTLQWLNNPGLKTILVNLGSHVISNADHIRELGGGLRILLSKFSDVQILWKIIADGEVQAALTEVVDGYRMKVVDWLQVDPHSILYHPDVICSVHHGGANSFFEAVSAGVPQVILPVWYDTYDYARRVECLGIGVYGSANSAPRADAQEFGRALIKVVGEASFTQKARGLAESCSSEAGRKLAVNTIMGFM
ncbi:hypothetical protein D9758_018848 [Tetrapyrgos nigripes]|uniref:Erythromycin biosynthesis protein CIII-like C-terminal domain-containing protein n=1 Tax=Tetrapyrgos nigripes TaxID=182062 RepID=A0A8H5BC76_9AGAR|nr:hypothetical protein D9758_018848 [Tetrapyrgos nigripes]